MAGETIRSEAICLDIRPWSKTSHVVSWLTPVGKVTTVAKGAERPKSYFLGQYDLNYTCDILYYAGAKGEIHALRDCVPVARRDDLRDDYRVLALAGYFRRLAAELAPKTVTREWCRLAPADRAAYERALADYRAGERRPGDAFALLTALKLACDGDGKRERLFHYRLQFAPPLQQ